MPTLLLTETAFVASREMIIKCLPHAALGTVARVAALARLADFATVATETAVAVLTDESIARNPTLNVPETHEMTRAQSQSLFYATVNRSVSRSPHFRFYLFPFPKLFLLSRLITRHFNYAHIATGRKSIMC